MRRGRNIIALATVFVLGGVGLAYSQLHQRMAGAQGGTQLRVEDEHEAQGQKALAELDSHDQDTLGFTQPSKSTFGIVYNVLIYVTHVESGSPAEEAGLKRGDLISRIGGLQVRGIQTLKAVQTLDPGTLVDVEYLRPNANSDTFTKFHGKVPLAALRDQ